MSDRARVTVGGTHLDLMTREQLRDEVRSALTGGGPLVVASSNLDHVFRFGRGGAHPDPARGRGAAVWLITADGFPIVRAARWLTGKAWPQLAGSDLLPDMLELAQATRSSVAFVGGFPDQHARIAAALDERFPELAVAGYWAPQRDDLASPWRSADLASSVAASGAELIIVGLGKPRQELWLADHMAATGASVALAFGAAADYLGGTAQRAPETWRRFGLEWFYRLVQEPRRLWRRYLLEGPVAVWRLLRGSSRAS